MIAGQRRRDAFGGQAEARGAPAHPRGPLPFRDSGLFSLLGPHSGLELSARTPVPERVPGGSQWLRERAGAHARRLRRRRTAAPTGGDGGGAGRGQPRSAKQGSGPDWATSVVKGTVA